MPTQSPVQPQTEDLLAIISEELAALEVERVDLNEKAIEIFFDTDKHYALVRQRAENFGQVLALSKIRGRLEGMAQVR
jgi:hypothetical protein